LYLTALGLSLAQHQFAPIFGAGGNAQYQVTTANVQETVVDAKGSNIVVLSDNLAETHRINGGTSVGTDLLLATGGRLTVAFTTSFLRYISGEQLNATGARLAGSFVQPLWRGAGYKVTMENLTQTERNVLYAIRDFTRFRKTFSVDVATSYYNVLRDRDEARNSFVNLQNSRRNADRTRALAKEGRVAQADLGRLEQQELTSENTWVGAVLNYKRALDNFKIQLGLPTDERIVLDDQELADLKIDHPEISVDDSIKVAMAMRLDYQNAHDEVDDAKRKIPVAANALRAKVDLVASARIDSDSGKLLPNPGRYSWDATLDVDLPLERTAERNAYRQAIINLEQAKRNYTLDEDQIKLQVRDSWRALEQARRAFEISKVGVELAERRVEEQNLLAELGRAKAQDQVDAQNDLSASKNQYTQALVGHTIARLQFWENLGILYIKSAGQWEEPKNAKLN
ncbi:MAG: TolC family protein, partial [Limisphaerales bacterium]